MPNVPSGLVFRNKFMAMGYPICPNPTNPNLIAKVELDHLLPSILRIVFLNRGRRIMAAVMIRSDP
jgi:hypothetical protein